MFYSKGCRDGATCPAPRDAPFLQKIHTHGNVVGSFKSAVTKWMRQNGKPDFSWQSRFYDHIIRNGNDLRRIRTYIKYNPLKWEIDEYYKK
jgi:REP-associated tyrosine transposase